MSEVNEAVITLVTDGKSEYQIVLPAKATASETRAAEELVSFIKEISGAELPIVSESQGLPAKAILLGKLRILSEVDVRIAWDWLGEDGYVIQTAAPHLVIAGGPAHGTLFGVYGFLEDHLGCRWYTPSISKIPKQQDIAIGAIEEMQVPAMIYRDLYYAEAMDPIFRARHKMNANLGNFDWSPGIAQIGPLTGGWCHTFFRLCPPEQYLESHPEYFSLIDGERKPHQLCLTNPEVLPIVIENLRKEMAAHPDQKYWAIAPMDNGDPCQCEVCKAVDAREGSPMGNVLEFVNKIAEAFPDKMISTHAYWYTLKAPKNVVPAENVHIMYCSEGNRSRPFVGDPLSVAEVANFKYWTQVASEIYLWDYYIRYGTFITPMPNFASLGPNMQFFVSHGVMGIFAEGSFTPKGEFAELRAYLLAKLIWNPDADVYALMDEFLPVFYGPAAPMVREYIDVMQAKAESLDFPVITNGGVRGHTQGYLSEEMLAKYYAIIDKAEAAVADNPELLPRVQHIRLQVKIVEAIIGYGDLDYRLKVIDEADDLAKRTGVEYFGDFNERPREKFLAELKEKAQ
jgi:hypothetical protein